MLSLECDNRESCIKKILCRFFWFPSLVWFTLMSHVNLISMCGRSLDVELFEMTQDYMRNGTITNFLEPTIHNRVIKIGSENRYINTRPFKM